MAVNIRGLFNAKAILVEHVWYYLTDSWKYISVYIYIYIYIYIHAKSILKQSFH